MRCSRTPARDLIRVFRGAMASVLPNQNLTRRSFVVESDRCVAVFPLRTRQAAIFSDGGLQFV